MSVADRMLQLQVRIDQACKRAGRQRNSVRWIAVSKLQSDAKVREAYNAGQRDFAENYAQEFSAKQDRLKDLDIRWHFIGRLQTNKVKALVGRVDVLHSVDRISLADAWQKLAPVRTDVFLQFNVAAEASKGGADEAALVALAKHVNAHCPNLRVLGLMAMPPLEGDARPYFQQTREMLYQLKRDIGGDHPWDQLSMGTSHDFETAIEEGATWIRIGTDVFGPREEKV